MTFDSNTFSNRLVVFWWLIRNFKKKRNAQVDVISVNLMNYLQAKSKQIVSRCFDEK